MVLTAGEPVLFSCLLPCFSPLFSYGCEISWISSHLQAGTGMHGWTEREGRSLWQRSAVRSVWAKQNKSYLLQHLCALYPWGYRCLLIHNRWLLKNVISLHKA